MSDRIPDVPPIILPVEDTAEQPLWSVMIPTYNCIAFLEDTLKSVLLQDPGEALMQIEVVDDFSADGDVFELVETIGKGRIKYYKQERNRGSLRNFETCLNRAKGKWIHLLHGDDRIEVGYYQEIESLFIAHPEAGAAFTNFSFIDGRSDKLDISTPILSKKPEVIKDFLSKIAGRQLIQPPAIVVKRSVYEALGSFYAVHYGEDWEMWTRIAAHYPVAYSPKSLAYYRVAYNSGISHGSFLTGQNIHDIIKVVDIIQEYIPINKRKKLKEEALVYYAIFCIKVANNLLLTNKDAAFLQAKGAFNMHKNLKTYYWMYRFYLMHFFRFKQIQKLVKS
ncbi:MAG: glycosyltransferase family 2 protein [Janthinobacterium lividum]